MPYIFLNPKRLEKQLLVGGGNCVDLIKGLVPGLKGLRTSAWRRGAHVVDTAGIVPGTAIATFDEHGHYPNRSHGNHAAIFLASAGAAIWVIDQWRGDSRRPWVDRRLIYPQRPLKDGTFIDASNAAGAFYVIER